jgi:hypothetical protein
LNSDAACRNAVPHEQAAKASWETEPEQDPGRNPYSELPEMQMFTYALSEMTETGLDKNTEGIFDLSGFFSARKVGSEYHFDDANRVTGFLNMLTGKLTQNALNKLLDDRRPPFPYANDTRLAGR